MCRAFLYLAVVLVVLGAPIAWAGEACLVDYDDFEENVSHIDLDACPAGEVAVDEGFCRLGIERGLAIIYVFRHEEDEICLTEARSLPIASFLRQYAYTPAD